ncbi:hypothetical protein LWV33_08230 [Brucella intermedia]
MNDAAMQNIAKAPLVEVRNLITRFELKGGLLGRTTGRVHAVESVSFDIFPGETLALVGEIRLRQVHGGTEHHATGQTAVRFDPV